MAITTFNNVKIVSENALEKDGMKDGRRVFLKRDTSVSLETGRRDRKG